MARRTATVAQERAQRRRAQSRRQALRSHESGLAMALDSKAWIAVSSDDWRQADCTLRGRAVANTVTTIPTDPGATIRRLTHRPARWRSSDATSMWRHFSPHWRRAAIVRQSASNPGKRGGASNLRAMANLPGAGRLAARVARALHYRTIVRIGAFARRSDPRRFTPFGSRRKK